MTEILNAVLGMGEEDTLKGKFLTFALGKEEYGIEIRYVTEIIGIQVITEVPELPEYVKGIINLRGKIIPVIDVRLRFSKEARDYNDRTCIIVIEIKDVYVGLIVDTVAEVISIAEQEIVPPPQVNNGGHHKYIEGIGKVGSSVKLLLDCYKLLSDYEIESLSYIS
jgi:purine-binding chemotaxis protein CheW